MESAGRTRIGRLAVMAAILPPVALSFAMGSAISQTDVFRTAVLLPALAIGGTRLAQLDSFALSRVTAYPNEVWASAMNAVALAAGALSSYIKFLGDIGRGFYCRLNVHHRSKRAQ